MNGLLDVWDHKGNRKSMEDASLSLTIKTPQGEARVTCLMDGHGGISAVEFVRGNLELLLTEVWQDLKPTSTIEEYRICLARLPGMIDRAMWDTEKELYWECGATLIVLVHWSDRNVALLLNLGDSRAAWRSTTKEAPTLTTSHNFDQVSEHRRGARVIRKRKAQGLHWSKTGSTRYMCIGNRGLSVGRAIGDLCLKVNEHGEYIGDRSAPISSVPEVHYLVIDKSIQMALYTDGVENTDVKQSEPSALLDALAEGRKAKQVGQSLCRQARRKYGNTLDNLSLILMTLRPETTVSDSTSPSSSSSSCSSSTSPSPSMSESPPKRQRSSSGSSSTNTSPSPSMTESPPKRQRSDPVSDSGSTSTCAECHSASESSSNLCVSCMSNFLSSVVSK
jgi:serine/threonine protein phosphatase PrpC